MASNELALGEFPITGDTPAEKAAVLHGYAMDLYQRHKEGNETDALEKAICLNQQALSLCPIGHPERSLYLHDLGNCIRCRYEAQEALGDLEESIFLHQQALDLRPVSHPDRSSSLNDLAICMHHRYEAQGALGDLQEAITLHKQGLELCPVGHPDRSLCLDNLANCMKCKYESHKVLLYLEEAISLNQQALELHPVGHANRPSSLMHLAACIKCRYEAQKTLGDLEDALSLYQQALELCPDGHPDRPACLMYLATCMQCKYDLQGEMKDLLEAILLFQQALDLCPSGSKMWVSVARKLVSSLEDKFKQTKSTSDKLQALELQQALPYLAPNQTPTLQSTIAPAARQLIYSAVQDVLHNIPPRLLNTKTGVLHTKEQMITQFYESAEHMALATFLNEGGVLDSDQHSNSKHLRESIAAYFQYATLSHRWGANEPTLEGVFGRDSIYKIPDTEGLIKLRKFCLTAAEHGYSWAWTDTCCIDKTNSVELQQAIGSMFLWYQKSGLTIVHLYDVPPSSSSDAFTSSVWFRRGWTLQELLAPNTVLFYTKDWTPYMSSKALNHKEDALLLNELESATGIPSKHLIKFRAGVDDAREKLQWATGRRTTQAEDLAYSLFGIFDLHLPVLYGEGKEKSLGRLLQEVLSRSHDVSILHWVGEQSSLHSCFPASMMSYQPLPRVQPEVTNVGIQLALSRLQRIVSTDDARKVYNHFVNLARARFANHTLTLPCVIHQVRELKLRKTHLKGHTYDVYAEGLRPVQVTSPEALKETTEFARLPYVLVRPWDRKTVDYSEQDPVTAGYKTLMTLEQPFMALMLQRLLEGEYKRICTGHLIIVRTDDPASIINSTTDTLDIV